VNRLLHLHPSRRLPALAAQSFAARHSRGRAEAPSGSSGAHEGRSRAEAPSGSSGAKADVLLWADTFTNYFQPHIAEAACEVLSAAGRNVKVLRRHVCCGRPLYDFGMLDRARQYLCDALDALSDEISAGTPIVVLEPSCASVFRDEAPNLMPDDPRTGKLKQQTFLLSEFLQKHAPGYRPARLEGRQVLVHMHCHHRALFDIKDEVAVLHATGADTSVLDAGCCGMAGPFGFEQKSYEVSQVLAERVLLPAVRRSAPTTVIVTDGFSCREQIAQNTHRRAVHVAEVLAGRI
jgi:Fe-S oxidoreductase